MNSVNEMMINLACIENGIVPLCSGKSGHVKNALHSLTPQQRRKTIRKFRKLLKRAIRAEALQSGPVNSIPYHNHKQFLSRLAGLRPKERIPSVTEQAFITPAQSVFRAKMVRDYLQRSPLVDN